MEKNEILSRLEHAKMLEERAIPIYTKHLEVVLAWGGLDEETEKKIAGYLTVMTKESVDHSKMLDSIIKIING